MYALIAAMTIWGGIRLINSSIDTRLYTDYLQKWVVAIDDYDSEGRRWPQFSGGNHSDYMEMLAHSMRRASVTAPPSNTQRPYVYKIGKIGSKATFIFLLCFADKIILYGIPEKTFERLDVLIDGVPGPEKGNFTGYRSKAKKTYTGIFKL